MAEQETLNLKVKFDADLKALEEAAQKVNLSPTSKASAAQNLNKINMALGANSLGDFKKYVNRYIDILKNAVGSMPGIDKNFKILQDNLSKLNEKINSAIESRAAISSRFVGGKVSQQSKYSDEAAKQALRAAHPSWDDKQIDQLYKTIEAVIERTGNDWRKLNAELIKNLNTSFSKEDIRAGRDTIRAAQQADVQRFNVLGREQRQAETEKTAIDTTLNNIAPSSKEAAEGLNQLYEAIVQIQNTFNTKVSSVRKEQEENKTPNIGGINTSDEITKPIERQTSALGKAFKQFTIYAVAVRAARRALGEAKKTIQDLDKYLTEQAMVTGKTRSETYALLKTYQDLSKQLGTTTKDVANVATQYMRQGKTTQDALTLTEAAISAAKVAGISASESVNYLTTALNGFQLSAESAMKVSDKFAAIAATSATSYEEIATALSKVASQANLAGMSIDYTTALLAKGIETTREAPETIGTALKTIIARMRELTDYGETLEGDTDLNNVETQLAYVGIQLRNTNGELRSTEDVLNDLGGKWDTLNSNQQAAVAKALAGTRQQSRLIAMMSDYERVIELQAIAQRSQGTTLAQMDTYLQGMDAALNRINVAWESIITGLVNSDVIISLFNTFGSILDVISGITNSTFGLISAMAIISAIGLNILTQKITENRLGKMQHALELDQQKVALKNQEIAAKAFLNEQKTTIEQKRQLLLEKQQNIEKARAVLYSETASQADKDAARADITRLTIEAQDLELAIKKQENAQYLVNTYDAQNALLTQQQGLVGQISGNFLGILGLFKTITLLQKSWNVGLQAGAKYHDVLAAKQDKVAAKQARNNALAGQGMFAHVVAAFAQLGPVGVALGVATGVALAAAIGLAIAASVGAFKPAEEKTSDAINKLSVEILNLEKKSQAIDTAISKFDELDNAIIKTKEDAEAMTEALDNIADKLSSDSTKNTKGLNIGDKSEKEYYESLRTNKARREFAETVSRLSKEQADEARRETLRWVRSLQARGGDAWKNFQTDSEFLQSRDEIYAIANSTLYKNIDALKATGTLTSEAASATESFTQALLENIDDLDQIIDYADESTGALKDLIGVITSAEITVDGVNTKAAEILNSEDFDLKTKVAAFKQMEIALRNNEDAWKSFSDVYSQYTLFADLDQYGDEVLDFLEKSKINIKDIQELSKGYESLQKAGMQITKEEYQSRFQNYLVALARFNGDVAAATHEVFDDLLSTTDNYQKVWNQLITNFGNIVEAGVLNMGQNIDKLKNQINSFYETSTKWSSMSETERTQFLSNNQDFFMGQPELMSAFESGNFQIIEQALRNNEVLRDKMREMREQIEQELKIELAREGDARNEAYIKYLQDQRAFFADEKQIYQAQLDVRLEQENKALDQYKALLKKQQDALTESLEKRKEAYQSYFDAVNQTEEDTDYEDQAALLISNMAKLGSSTDATAMRQQHEMQQQLEALEKERLEELRQRAQEQIIGNIDNEISSINNKFDQLLENSRELLAQLTNLVHTDPYMLLAQEIAQANSEGLTLNSMQELLNNLSTTYGSQTSGIDWDSIGVREENNNLILTVSGQEIVLSNNDQQAVMDAVYTALRQLGLK